MVSFLLLFFDKAIRALSDFFSLCYMNRKIPVVYFDGRPNVGDALNSYLIKKLTGKEIYRAKTNKFKHVRFVGSVLGSASDKSYIYGGGSIDGRKPNSLDKNRIYALRGYKSLSLVKEFFDCESMNVALGDPAVLLPEFYTPDVSKRKYIVGIIPHFVDEKCEALSEISDLENVVLIDVSCGVEEFIDKIKSCKYILSSSLHGLILADAYGVPNKRVVFSNKIIGGDYKFEDYYSVTDSSDAKGLFVKNKKDMCEIISQVDNVCRVNLFKEDKLLLMNAIKKIGLW